jgi:hypothetical protein
MSIVKTNKFQNLAGQTYQGIAQVVQVTSNTGYYSSSQTTIALTNLTTSITPYFTTSKIMIVPALSSFRYGGTSGWKLTVYRNGTLIYNPSANYEVYHNSTDDEYNRESWWIYDTPSSTALQTYTFYLTTYAASSGAGINYNSYYTSMITLLEVLQ